jgi:hypothetical protein
VLEFFNMGLHKTIGIVALLASSRISLQTENTKPKSLPSGVLQALARDEKDYCDQFLGDFKKNCKQTFRANLMWREVELSPQGRAAFLIEIHSVGACGSAGCTLYVFVQQRNTEFVQVLGDVGDLDSVKILKSATGGYYDIQKTWRNGKTETVYKWDGKRYSRFKEDFS